MRKIEYVWVISPDGYIHSQCFNEIARSMSEALQELGHPAVMVDTKPPREISLVFGAHLSRQILPPEFILFNTEQITDDSNWMKMGYLQVLKNHQIWDYSPVNVVALKNHGLHAVHCEIGYTPSMTDIEPVNHDIDVLFVGSSNSRRDLLIKNLSKKFEVYYAQGVYGKIRNDLIARAKIVLNLHYYDSAIFEIVRCSHLMANKKCVVSEYGNDKALEEKYYGAIDFCRYEDIEDECERLLSNPHLIESYGKAGFERFSAFSQKEILSVALDGMMP